MECELIKPVFFSRKMGVYPEFSNMYLSPVTMDDGLTYPSNENAFQAYKCIDITQRTAFLEVAPYVAKKLGRSVCIRSDWDTVRFYVMLQCVRNKFTQNKPLADLLKGTGRAWLVENTTGWKDNTWGCDFNMYSDSKNWLGLCLMIVRAELTGDGIACVPSFKGNIEFDIVKNWEALYHDYNVYSAVNRLLRWSYSTMAT